MAIRNFGPGDRVAVATGERREDGHYHYEDGYFHAIVSGVDASGAFLVTAEMGDQSEPTAVPASRLMEPNE